MNKTIRLIQEATGGEDVVFGELRSLLASPTPENYLRLAPLITAQYKRDYSRFQDELEPYLEAQLSRWPDSAKAVPLDVMLALAIEASEPIPSGVLWIARNAKRIDGRGGDSISLVASDGEISFTGNKLAFGATKRYTMSMTYYEMKELFTSEAFKGSRHRYLTVFGVDFDLMRGDEIYDVIDDKASGLSELVWVPKADEVDRRGGPLAALAAGRFGNKIGQIRSLNFAAYYAWRDAFEADVRSVYGHGYGFEVLVLDIVNSPGMSLQDAQEIMLRVNADTDRGNQRIIVQR